MTEQNDDVVEEKDENIQDDGVDKFVGKYAVRGSIQLEEEDDTI